MSRNLESSRSVCCWTTSSLKTELTDIYLKVSKTYMDEMLIEKTQARITNQRMEIANEKFTRTLSELQAKLAEKENQLSRLEAKFNSDGIESERNYTTSIDTRPGLTKKKTPGIDFEKYLIKDGQGTPSGFSYSSIDDQNENKSVCQLKEDIEEENLDNISNNSEKGLVKYDKSSIQVKSLPTFKLSFIANEVSEEDKECRFWFYR